MANKKKVIALSGGLDSVVLAHKLKDDGVDLYGVVTDFGALNSEREIKSAKYFASKLNINLEIINVNGLGNLVSTYGFIGSLDGGDTHDPDPPGEMDIHGAMNQPPTGFYLNVAIAAYYARLLDINTLALGITKDDIEGRPNLLHYFEQWQKLVPLIETTNKNGLFSDPKSFTIEIPFAEKRKSDVVNLGNSLNIQLDTTYSCYYGRILHCGKCSACTSRKKGFKDSSHNDPTWYEELPNVGSKKLWGL